MEPLQSTLKRPRIDDIPEEETSLAALEKASDELLKLSVKFIRPHQVSESTCPHEPLKKRITVLKQEIAAMKGLLSKEPELPKSDKTLADPAAIARKREQSELTFRILILTAALQSGIAKGINSGSKAYQKPLKDLMEKWPSLKDSVSKPYVEFYNEFCNAFNTASISSDAYAAKGDRKSTTLRASLQAGKHYGTSWDGTPTYQYDILLTACTAYAFKNPSFPLLKDCFEQYLFGGHPEILISVRTIYDPRILWFRINLSAIPQIKNLQSILTPVSYKYGFYSNSDTFLLTQCDLSAFGAEVEQILCKHYNLLCQMVLSLFSNDINEVEWTKFRACFQNFHELSQNLGISDKLLPEAQTIVELAKSFLEKTPEGLISCSFRPIEMLCYAMLYSKYLRENPPHYLLRKAIEFGIVKTKLQYSLEALLVFDAEPGLLWKEYQRYEILVTTSENPKQMRKFTLDEFIKFIPEIRI